MSNKWISVKENLPKEGGRYWCYLEHQTDLGLSRFQWNCSYNETSKTFSDRYLTDGEKVTHWQPLPPPPGEEENLSKEPVEPIIGPINWEEVQKEMNEWEEERKVRSAKAAIEVASIHFTSELSKEPISEDELKEKFKNVLPMGMPSVLNDCIEIAQQYSGSKLEELEKWCDEKIKEYYHPNEPIASEKYASPYKQLKSKIQSLK